MQYYIITQEHLEKFGIKLPQEERENLLKHLNDTLNERIGLEIAEYLDDNELAELVDLQKNAKPEKVYDWLTQHVDELEEIVKDEIAIILGDIAKNADGFNASVQQ